MKIKMVDDDTILIMENDRGEWQMEKHYACTEFVGYGKENIILVMCEGLQDGTTDILVVAMQCDCLITSFHERVSWEESYAKVEELVNRASSYEEGLLEES